MRTLPYVETAAVVNEGDLSRKLLDPKTERDKWFSELYRWVASVVPRGSDGEINHPAACIAAMSMSRVAADVEISDESLLGAYFAAEWLVGRRDVDWEDWVGGVEMDEELLREIRGADEWHPGKVGRPPKNAWANYMVKNGYWRR